MHRNSNVIDPVSSAWVANLAMRLVGKTRLHEVVEVALDALAASRPRTAWAVLERVGLHRYRGHATAGVSGDDLRCLARLALGGQISVVNACVSAAQPVGMPRWSCSAENGEPRVVLGAWPMGEMVPHADELGAVACLLASAFAATGEIEHLRRASERDELTQINNRKAILEILAMQQAQAARFPSPLSVLFVDLDRFKVVNDQHGHLVGDLALRHVAQALAETIRGSDAVGRVGGDEFLVVLPDTDHATARQVAQRLRDKVARRPLVAQGARLDLSISVGVASSDRDGDLDLVGLADRRMLDAKRARSQRPDLRAI